MKKILFTENIPCDECGEGSYQEMVRATAWLRRGELRAQYRIQTIGICCDHCGHNQKIMEFYSKFKDLFSLEYRIPRSDLTVMSYGVTCVSGKPVASPGKMVFPGFEDIPEREIEYIFYKRSLVKPNWFTKLFFGKCLFWETGYGSIHYEQDLDT